jgi:hypothetical protein
MEENKLMSPVEALEDFFAFALSPENRKVFIGRERHYIKKTKADLLAGEKIGLRRIKSVLGLAPGRYEFHESVFVTKKTAPE